MSFNKPLLISLIEKGETIIEHILGVLAPEINEGGRLSLKKLDEKQILLTDLVWVKSELLAARSIVNYAERVGNELSQRLVTFYVADVLHDASGKFLPYLADVKLSPEKMAESLWSIELVQFVQQNLASAEITKTARLIERAQSGGVYGLNEEQNMIRDTFKKYAEEHVMPIAEKVHREDLLIPEEIINGLVEMGCFGLCIPQRYGGFQDDEKADNMGMIIVTEELSRGSLGVAGSLITRPEILSKALLKGGTEEQKQKWLSQLATGEKMAAVAVTEPDYGSDVAGMKVAATKTNGGWLINGVKTWCTFAGYADTLLVLVRTNPDLSLGHKGLSILIAEKPRFQGHEFSYDQEGGGHIEGKAIGTIGYRGMHSYEVSFQNYFVPDENVIGLNKGLGQGFYLQMAGFSGGRLQTAARALGVMQAAFEKGLQYSTERSVFNQTIINYQITQYKLVRMAAIIQATRQITYDAAKLMDAGMGQMEASLVKYYASKVSEWVTREAMQLHGGMGYAEEYAVSRYFVDASVFRIFEGAEDVLVMRVIARSLLENQIKS